MAVTQRASPPRRAPLGSRSTLSQLRKLFDQFFGVLVTGAALALLALFVLFIYVLGRASWLSIQLFGFSFLVGSIWAPGPPHPQFGALPFIYGTLVTSAIAMAIAIPISLGVAIVLAELLPTWVRVPLGAVVDLLAAIPSVVYGLWGFLILAPYMAATVEPQIRTDVSSVPGIGHWLSINVLGSSTSGSNVFTAGIVLAIMVIPTISAISREVMKAVPQAQREAALSLGATRWESTRVGVLKYARSGIVGAVILGLGRAVGETMAVTMTIGNIDVIPSGLFSTGQTMASLIATELGGAEPGGPYRPAIIEIGLVLLIITVLINVCARLFIWRITRKSGEVNA